MSGLIANTNPKPSTLAELPIVVDIGAGLRPMGWYKPERHICVEPYKPYADELRKAGYEVVEMTAAEYIEHIPNGRVLVCMLDVIEHMPKDEGDQLLLTLQNGIQPEQIVVTTPYGFLPQEGDAWGMGGDFWQKHRSGWTPDNFPGWKVTIYDDAADHKFFTAVYP